MRGASKWGRQFTKKNAGTWPAFFWVQEAVTSEGQARQKWLRKRSLRIVNEHSEPVFNAPFFS
ncbi:MAG TPA: hypothetical protein VJA19_22795, partial [Pseudomonas sp.]|nr:hypothetical protein [Pseudomonas sp.]